MAGGTSPPHGATRFVETTRGILSYTQLAPLLAERVLAVEQAVERGEFHAQPISAELIAELHQRLCGDLVPDWAGRWRLMDVRVGEHTPPPPFQVPGLMRDYAADLQARLTDFATRPDPELLPEHLAFAEGRLLSIHPFPDFNGRLTRLWLRELLARLDLPAVELVPATPAATHTYLAALRAADQRDTAPLQQLWLRRLEAAMGGEAGRAE
jgi:CRISPR-associated endonuclease/helicase Cas3